MILLCLLVQADKYIVKVGIPDGNTTTAEMKNKGHYFFDSFLMVQAENESH